MQAVAKTRLREGWPYEFSNKSLWLWQTGAGGEGMRIAAIVLLMGLSIVGQEKPSSTTQEFNGTYEHLRPAQKRLIDQWYAEYNQMTGEHDDPHDYDQLSLSTRTTFEAVTHALLTTTVTDKSGKSLGNALELVQSIETINGKVPRARGDLQFRMYVVLKPDAYSKLKESGEFFRDRDNTIYHHGYPLNYRQDGGTPSIQVSMAKDGRHADIDVDYRSSKFPEALFNGHLTAANSDVRAGGNTQKHLQRWDGLSDWWRNLFGLADPREEVAEPEGTATAGEVPPIPRKGDQRVEDAVNDFLTSWLVDQKPEIAAAYLSAQSFSCLEEYGPQAGKEINAGVAPYLAARDMAATNQLMGKPANLQAAIKAATLSDPNVKFVNHKYGDAFALYQMSKAIAADFECDPERAFSDFESSRVSGKKVKSGNYFGSVFQLKPTSGKGDTITMVWSRQGKYWKVVSWDIEPDDSKPEAVPDTRHLSTSAETEQTTPIQANPDFLRASDQFLRLWLVADDFSAAVRYFSQASNDCMNRFLQPGEKATKTGDEYTVHLRNALSIVGKDVGRTQHLRDTIEPTAPDHADLKVVRHKSDDAYAVVAVPDSLADMFSCKNRSSSNPYDASLQGAPTYGKYYATTFAFRTPGDHPAALTFLWTKEGSDWKIIAYQMVFP